MANDTFSTDPQDALSADRTQLRSQLAELEGGNFDDNFADSGQVAAEQGEARVLAGSLREQLDEVEAALEKLDAGTYGTCERCANAISESRLEAMPQARHCINCA